MAFIRAYPGTSDTDAPKGLWFILHNGGFVLQVRDAALAFPDGAAPVALDAGRVLKVGELAGRPAFAVALDEGSALPPGLRAFGLRDLYGRVPEAEFAIAGYASQLLNWQRVSNFCGVCGGRLAPMHGEWGKRCPGCTHTIYPPVSPCTITLIHDGTGPQARILMTHKDGRGPRFGLVAGFVEPGETLEENVHREIAEETGVAVDDVRYWRSQPWPFPHQLMCGYYARYAGGEVVIDRAELDDARWFTREDILAGRVTIPAPLSIARQLIDNWLRHMP